MKARTQYCIAFVDEQNHGRFIRFSTELDRTKYIHRLKKKIAYATWEHELEAKENV